MDKKEFRKDINSLRAIAVISVIFFHFFYNIDEEYSFTIPFLSDYFSISIFQAGYLGVDIFFVVSGFLMTKIIVTGLDKNSFSVGKFGKARAKRICPTLFFMLCLFTLISYLLFSTDLLLKYVRQVQGALLFISNVRFAHRVDYFAENDLLSNVLLHCGSLSVEGQFYILYPFLLIFISKYFKNGRLNILCLLFTLSLITSLFLELNISYYYLQSRAGELLAGGIVFLLPQNKGQGLNKKSYIILIFFVLVICFSPKDGNSISALLIVLLTSLIIYINKKDSFLFNSNIVQYLGKISYSLYLYHWPIVCLYSSLFAFSFIGFFSAVLIIFFLASLSYLFVERSRNYRWLFLALYIFLTIFVTLEASAKGTLIKQQTVNFANGVYINECSKNDVAKLEKSTNLVLNGINRNKESKILVIGDSNAKHFATYFFKNYDSFYSITLDGVLPYSKSLGKINSTKEQRDLFNNNLKNFLKNTEDAIVFLSNRWTLYFLERNKGEKHQEILKDIDEDLRIILNNNKDDSFIIIGVTPIIPKSLLNSSLLVNAFQKLKISTRIQQKQYFLEKQEGIELDELLKKYFSQFENVEYVSPLDVLCKNKKCRVFDNSRYLLFFDTTHFSKYGSNFMEPYLSKAYEQVNNKR